MSTRHQAGPEAWFLRSCGELYSCSAIASKNGANQRAHSWHAIVLPYNTVDTYHNSMLCLASPLQRAALDQETGHAEPRISQGYGLSSMHGPEQVMLLGHASDKERVYTRLGFFV